MFTLIASNENEKVFRISFANHVTVEIEFDRSLVEDKSNSFPDGKLRIYNTSNPEDISLTNKFAEEILTEHSVMNHISFVGVRTYMLALNWASNL